MSRINTNVQSLIAQRVLGQNNMSLNNSLERLSTGLRINRGKDDPAGLIASENLKSDITATNAAINNAERADQVVNIAEGGLNEVSNLLTELQGLLTASANTAGLSEAEKEANQLQIDSILQTVDRIAGATSFQGTKLLNGSFDYNTTSVASGVSDFKINGAKFNGASQNVNVIVTQSAQQGSLYLSFGGASLDLASTGSSFTLEISGSVGSRELSFASGTAMSAMVATINTFSDLTGVTATASTTTGITLRSTEYGSDEFVTVKAGGNAVTGGDGVFTYAAGDANTLSGTTAAATFSALANPFTDDGQDIGGTINGVVATGAGRQLAVNTDFLDVSLTLSTATGDALNALELNSAKAFDITGGGADFQLAGQVDIGGRVSLGVSDIATRKLGRSDLGFLDDLASGQSFNVVEGSSSQLATAQKIVGEAIEQVSSTRGRLGAFQKNVIGATIRNLGVSVENTSAANSVIRDADFASETAALTRSQILQQASTNTLALANQGPQAVLQLLG